MTSTPGSDGPDTVVLVYPHQLYRHHPAVQRGSRPVFLVEDPLFFRQFAFSRVSLAYHRLTMEAYRAELQRTGHTVSLIPSAHIATSADVFQLLPPSVRRVVVCEVDDDWLRQAIDTGSAATGITVEYVTSPGFILTRSQVVAAGNGGTSLHMAHFYRTMRTEMNVLLTPDGGPVGGTWSLDTENRKKIPRRQTPPPAVAPVHGDAAHRAAAAIQEELPPYPITAEDAARWLEEFIYQRLDLFGPYEDAVDDRDDRWYHAVLTPMLNAGLLTPQEILEAVLHEAERRNRLDAPIPLNSLEGFVRQLLGWREFMRVAYHLHGREMRTRNFWNHTRRIPVAFYEGTTGLPPVDAVITKVNRLGWAHHIERLMVVGNVMLLCEFDPDAVYRWFMELFVDAYDWVMVPNVYGMSQYADGGLITTKPYISGSNYLRKMSNTSPGPWQETWDGLYWRFIDRHREFFAGNPRLSLMPRQLDRLDPQRRRKIFAAAHRFLQEL